MGSELAAGFLAFYVTWDYGYFGLPVTVNDDAPIWTELFGVDGS